MILKPSFILIILVGFLVLLEARENPPLKIGSNDGTKSIELKYMDRTNSKEHVRLNFKASVGSEGIDKDFLNGVYWYKTDNRFSPPSGGLAGAAGFAIEIHCLKADEKSKCQVKDLEPKLYSIKFVDNMGIGVERKDAKLITPETEVVLSGTQQQTDIIYSLTKDEYTSLTLPTLGTTTYFQCAHRVADLPSKSISNNSFKVNSEDLSQITATLPDSFPVVKIDVPKATSSSKDTQNPAPSSKTSTSSSRDFVLPVLSLVAACISSALI